LLRDALQREGFVDVERCAFRQGHLPDLDILDNRQDESLFVEARRPSALAGISPEAPA